MSMHPRRAGRNRREILRNSGDSGKPAAQAKRGRPERGADRSEGPTEGPGRVVLVPRKHTHGAAFDR